MNSVVTIEFYKNQDGTYALRLQAPPTHVLPLADLHSGLCSILQGLGQKAIPRPEVELITFGATGIQVVPQ